MFKSPIKFRIKSDYAIGVGSHGGMDVKPIYIPQKRVFLFWFNVLDLPIPKYDRPKTLRHGFLDDREKAEAIIHTLAGRKYRVPLV